MGTARGRVTDLGFRGLGCIPGLEYLLAQKKIVVVVVVVVVVVAAGQTIWPISSNQLLAGN